MAVVVDMDLPQMCLMCPFYTDAWSYCRQKNIKIEQALERHKDCPLKEVSTAHWKSYSHSAYHGTDEDGEPIWKEVMVHHCSNCNRRTVIKEKYCPSCGALMIEEQTGENI